MLPLVLVAAIVTQDATPLRAAATEKAARQTLLYGGDWLELRGERQGWLQVYDHRHERPGYVRPTQVRAFPVDESSARELAAVIDFVREQPGAEALGIGLVALYLRAAPAAAVGAEVFDALGGMAQRLARRGTAAQIEVAESYGVRFKTFERDGKARTCYDGEAFRRVLALPASPSAKARAALALTEPGCVDPATAAADRDALVAWQADTLDKAASSASPPAPAWLVGRLRIRRAAVRAELAYVAARKRDWKAAATAAETATKELALVDKPELADDDALAFDDAALRVAAVRWATETAAPGAKVALAADGKPGETCVRVGKLEHCTYAVVWPASVRLSPRGDAVAFAQSPLPAWTEVVVLGHGKAQTLAPAAIDPDVGYVEVAGWSPDGARLCLVREARMTGPLGAPNTLAPWIARSFQIARADTLAVEKQAARLDSFVTFRRWAAPSWQRATLALR